MVQYYTLDEAARALHTTTDEVKKLAEEKKVRSFRDRGTLRFRADEIDELARQRGFGSDPALQLGEVPAPARKSTVATRKKEEAAEDDDEQVTLGHEVLQGGSKSDSGKKGPKSPKPGSDSDVRLVGDDLEVPTPPPGPRAKPATPPPSKRKPSKLGGPDSSVRLIPPDDGSDSDVKMVLEPEDEVALGGTKAKTASDSDVRIEPGKSEGKGSNPEITDEIEVPVEIPRPAKGKKSAVKPAPQLPTTSPFELSEEDVELPPSTAKPGRKQTQAAPGDDSDDYKLVPGGESPLELGSDEMPRLQDEDQDMTLAGPKIANTGVNLTEPVDSGIPLEQDGSDEFQLVEEPPAAKSAAKPRKGDKQGEKPDKTGTRKPAQKAVSPEDSSDDFELSLDAESPPAEESMTSDSDSEFELSLDAEPSSSEVESDSSEFELTLDSEGALESPADSDSSEVELSVDPEQSAELNLNLETTGDSDSEFELSLDEVGDESAEKDIFADTDFEVPALDDESGSEAVALSDDTDMESSDFDLALSDEDMVAEEESSSEVVSLEGGEEADEGASTVARPRKGRRQVLDDEEEPSDFAGIDRDEGEVAVMDDEETRPGRVRVEYVETPEAEWGPVPAIVLSISVILMFVVGLMSFELIQTMMGYRSGTKVTGLILHPLARSIVGDDKLPK